MNMEAVEEKKIKRHCRRRRSHLNEDVLINVLLRLPVKTLLRFRCVCKRWRYLISEDPYFIQLYCQQSKSKQPLFLFSSTRTFDLRKKGPLSFPLNSMDRKGKSISGFEVKFKSFFAKIVPTRFDLVCIQDEYIVHICNPSTHEFITLPKPPIPRLRFSSVGFGYVQSTDEYKVVRLVAPDYDYLELAGIFDAASYTTKCQVFTLGSSWVWREVMDSPYHVGNTCNSSPPAFVNGAIHWLVHYDHIIDGDVYDGDMIDPDYTIIAFDVESEEFRLVPHPEGCPNVWSFNSTPELQLVELRGLLCVCLLCEGFKMDIWMLKDYCYEIGDVHIRGTWVKEYSIDLNGMHRRYRREDNIFNYFAPRDIDDEKVLIETHRTGLGYYNLRSSSFKGFMHRLHMPNLEFSFYVESLRSLKTISAGKTLKQLK